MVQHVRGPFIVERLCHGILAVIVAVTVYYTCYRVITFPAAQATTNTPQLPRLRFLQQENQELCDHNRELLQIIGTLDPSNPCLEGHEHLIAHPADAP